MDAPSERLRCSAADTTSYRDEGVATTIALLNLVRRILEFSDETTDSERLIPPLATEFAPRLLQRKGQVQTVSAIH